MVFRWAQEKVRIQFKKLKNLLKIAMPMSWEVLARVLTHFSSADIFITSVSKLFVNLYCLSFIHSRWEKAQCFYNCQMGEIPVQKRESPGTGKNNRLHCFVEKDWAFSHVVRIGKGVATKLYFPEVLLCSITIVGLFFLFPILYISFLTIMTKTLI